MAIQYNKVSEPDSITQLKQTPIFDEWSVLTCGSKNDHQRGIVCLKEIALCAQNMLPILGSTVNVIEEPI
jgi:hypothetical protein